MYKHPSTMTETGAEEGSQFKGANYSTGKTFYGKKLNPMENS